MGIMAKPWKHPKTGVYYCRLSIPDDIRSQLNKSEIKESLGTKSLTEAKRLFLPKYAQYQQLFDELKLKRKREEALQEQARVNPDVLNLNDINILAARFYNQELEYLLSIDINNAQRIMKYELFAVRLGLWNDSPSALNDDNATDGLPLDTWNEAIDIFGDIADRLLADAGFVVPRTSSSYKHLIKRMSQYVPLLREHAGQVSFNPFSSYQPLTIANGVLSQSKASAQEQRKEAERVPEESLRIVQSNGNASGAKGLSFIKVFERYRESERLAYGGNDKSLDKRLADYVSAVKRFAEFTNGKDIRDITKNDVAEFRDLLLQLPSRPKAHVTAMPLLKQVEYVRVHDLPTISPSTAKKQLMALSAIFTFAIEQDLIQLNPIHGTTKRLSQSIERKAGESKQYSEDDVITIFTSPLFTQGYRPSQAKFGEAVYWLPLLAYYTGARVEELAQLYVNDVKQDKGIYYLHITADQDDKSVKNRSSIRKVPLHSHIVELGFVQYVASQPKDGRVFPELTRGGDGRYASRVSVWLTKYFRTQLNIPSHIKPLHGFRHSWKTLARNAEIPKDAGDVITGHSSGDVSGTYGGYSLELLAGYINRIPKLNLQ